SNALIVPEDERSVLVDGAARCNAELVAPERRLWRTSSIVKEIVGVQRAIPQKLINGAVKLVRARAGDGVHHAPGSLAVLGRIVAGQDAELLDGIHSQVSAQQTPRTAVRVVVDANAVQAIVILLRA